MADLHARQLAFLLERRIQLNMIAFSPRQGGTMLVICLSAESDVINQEITDVGSPGGEQQAAAAVLTTATKPFADLCRVMCSRASAA